MELMFLYDTAYKNKSKQISFQIKIIFAISL